MTDHQKLILEFILQGDSNKEIASKMATTEKSIKYHCSEIYKVEGVTTRPKLMAKYLEAKK